MGKYRPTTGPFLPFLGVKSLGLRCGRYREGKGQAVVGNWGKDEDAFPGQCRMHPVPFPN